jgi:hypothetical protein
MAGPQVADGGDGLQIWRVAADIVHKQSRTVDKVWSSTWGLVVELAAPSRKRISLIRNTTKGLGTMSCLTKLMNFPVF